MSRSALARASLRAPSALLDASPAIAARTCNITQSTVYTLYIQVYTKIQKYQRELAHNIKEHFRGKLGGAQHAFTVLHDICVCSPHQQRNMTKTQAHNSNINIAPRESTYCTSSSRACRVRPSLTEDASWSSQAGKVRVFTSSTCTSNTASLPEK